MKRMILLRGGNMVTGGGCFTGDLVLKDGLIDYAGQERVEASPDMDVIDVTGKYVSAGFIDLHTHGAGGADFMDGDIGSYGKALDMHAAHGTTLLYPTTLSGSRQSLADAVGFYRSAWKSCTGGAAMGGLHLEGPYFSPVQAGAQDRRYLRNPDPSEYEPLMEMADGDIARWSLAPELPGALEMAESLSRQGVLMAMGHTDATFDECDAAFRAGFTHFTHFYSCMSTVTRRNAFRYAGAVEYGYYNDDVTVEVIGDGIHVPESLLKLIFKIKGTERIALVTDSMRAAGMPDGRYILGSLSGGQEVIVEDEVAKLPDRSAFAGSVATMDRTVRTVTRLTGRPLPEIVRCATEIPARIMGISDRKGSIMKGYDADIVVFDENVDVLYTIVKGQVVYDKSKSVQSC